MSIKKSDYWVSAKKSTDYCSQIKADKDIIVHCFPQIQSRNFDQLGEYLNALPKSALWGALPLITNYFDWFRELYNNIRHENEARRCRAETSGQKQTQPCAANSIAAVQIIKIAKVFT